jgi:hypothetical protein
MGLAWNWSAGLQTGCTEGLLALRYFASRIRSRRNQNGFRKIKAHG